MRISIKGSSKNPEWLVTDLDTGERLTGIGSIDFGVDSHTKKPFCYIEFVNFEVDIEETPAKAK